MEESQRSGEPESPDATVSGDPQDLRDQAARLWSHGLHEDAIFVQRSNFFLVAESMFVVAYAALVSASASSGAPTAVLAARVIASFGFVFTMLWAYANHRQWRYQKILTKRTAELLPDYRATLAVRAGRAPSSTALTAYVTPLLGATMWIVLGLVP